MKKKNLTPCIFALRSYDAIFAIVKATERTPHKKWISKSYLLSYRVTLRD